MNYLILTQYTGKILGPIAKWILGPILNGIFYFLDWIKIPNVGLAILLFTIVIYLLLLPLTIKQQKFSKLQAKMQPELQAVQEKYKGKKDQESQMAMNQETQAVYAKYGVSPTGSCLQLLIQMPILLALYRVIYAVPAYVTKVKEAYIPLVSKIITQTGFAEFFSNKDNFSQAVGFSKQFTNELFLNGNTEYMSNTIIDVLNRASTSEWMSISNQYPNLKDLVDSTYDTISHFNTFLGLNIGNTPFYTMKEAFNNHSYLLVIGALLIPILSAVTQWINVKLTPTAANANSNPQADQMASSMKAMNTFMPIFSAVMCFSLPAGMGLYWIAGSVVRSIQQVAINKYIDKLDMDAEIKKNVEKRNAKLKKAGIDPNKLMQNASLSTKSVASNTNRRSMMDKTSVGNNSSESPATNSNAKPGSLFAKANMVKDYNEKNNK